MTLFQTILFAGDFSEASQEAFRAACSLACEEKTRVIVLNVLEPEYVAESPAYSGYQTLRYTRVARRQSEHDSVKRRLQEMYVPDRPIEVAYRTTEGDAAEAILPFSEEIACDLVVLGTHGRTGLPRLLSGSVAESVLRNARCPVLAIRQANRPAMAAATEIILHPTDFSESSHAALKVARALAQSRGARLVLLHVMPLETVMYGIAPTAYETEAACDSLTSLASELDGPDLKHPVGKLLAQGNAAAEIVRVAGEAPRSLIVMGTSGRSGLSRLLMGNVAESVLKKASCPVLMVKAPHPHASPSQAKPYSDGLAV